MTPRSRKHGKKSGNPKVPPSPPPENPEKSPDGKPAFPPSSFWQRQEAEAAGLYLFETRDEQAKAHHDALRKLDQQLEEIRSSPSSRPNPVFRYVLYFVLFLILLSFRDIRILYRESGNLLGLQRLYPADFSGVPPGTVWQRLSSRAEVLSEDIRVNPEEVENAQAVVKKIIEDQRKKNIGVLDWGIVIQIGDMAFVFGYNIFLNMLYAAGLTTVLFLRNREMTQSKLIDRQNRELSILNQRQALEMSETSRLLGILRRAQSRLLAAEKLASIGRLSATLAHEIRNPLGIISSSVGMVAEDVDPKSPSGQALDLVRHEIHRLNKIITDLLDFARPQVPNPSYFDVNDLVRDWTAILGDRFSDQHVRLLADLEPAPPEVFIDSDQLYQCFLNLAINAAEALEEVAGGDIVVTTKIESPDILLLEVRDNGNGIAPENISQVFEPFFTTKTTGSGLGLAVVRQTIEGMGGTVEIRTAMGHGTAVRLRLPTGPAAPISSFSTDSESDSDLAMYAEGDDSI